MLAAIERAAVIMKKDEMQKRLETAGEKQFFAAVMLFLCRKKVAAIQRIYTGGMQK